MVWRSIIVASFVGLLIGAALHFSDQIFARIPQAIDKDKLDTVNAVLDFIEKVVWILSGLGIAIAAISRFITGKKPIPPDSPAAPFSDHALQAQLAEYRRYLVESYKYLDFKGIDGIAEAVKGSSGIELEAVYVPLRARLDTPEGESWHRVGGRCYRGSKPIAGEDAEGQEQEMRRAEESAKPITQWMEESPALLILGDPGSGKSTTLKRLALELAQSENAPLPILAPLNAYSKALEISPVSFEDFLPAYFHAKRAQLAPDKLQELFTQALEQKQAVLLMDGLDEVGDNRGDVIARVESFVRAWIPDPQTQTRSGNRMIATSRFVGYRDCPLVDPRWRTVALNDWNREEIEHFFTAFTLASELAWSGHENRQNAAALATQECQALLRVIDANPGIRRLAGNPLLASLLALIKRQGVTLPHRRVELYKLYMETLLRSWNRARSLDRAPIGPEIDFSPTQCLLAKLALHLRQTNPQGGLIDEAAMRAYLLKHYLDDGYSRAEADTQAKGFLDSVHHYSNLLIEKGHQQYGFIHLTFEEYLAGFGLSLEAGGNLPAKIAECLETPRHWKETLLLALGVMTVVNPNQEKAQAVLNSLLESAKPEAILFAGEVLVDVGASVLGNLMARRIQEKLLALGQNGGENIGLRRRAGLLLGDSGWLPEDLDVFIKIPKGPCLLGEPKAQAMIEEDYWIGKYLVSNAQYKRFMDAGGYTRREWWTEEGWRHCVDKHWRGPEYWEEARFNNPLCPVVGISWFEAQAYCRWLEGQVQAHPEAYGLSAAASAHWAVRLPTIEESERAARGAEGLEFPWGEALRLECLNCAEAWTGVEAEQGSTAVNLFTQGASPEGLFDSAGNVWEWTSSLDSDGNPYIRGGSWGGVPGVARGAYRGRDRPNHRNNNLGFRVLRRGVLPGISGS
jgi:formylglycine-generating enzyme required for sulfatase activity